MSYNLGVPMTTRWSNVFVSMAGAASTQITHRSKIFFHEAGHKDKHFNMSFKNILRIFSGAVYMKPWGTRE